MYRIQFILVVLIGCYRFRHFCIQLFYWMLGLLDARTWKSARIPCYDKITVGVLFLNIKLKTYFLNIIFLWQSNLGRYLNFLHIFFFIQQVWFEILVKPHFLVQKSPFSAVLRMRAKTNAICALKWTLRI